MKTWDDRFREKRESGKFFSSPPPTNLVSLLFPSFLFVVLSHLCVCLVLLCCVFFLLTWSVISLGWDRREILERDVAERRDSTEKGPSLSSLVASAILLCSVLLCSIYLSALAFPVSMWVSFSSLFSSQRWVTGKRRDDSQTRQEGWERWEKD